MDLITFTHCIAMSLHRVGLAGAAVDMKLFHKLGKQWTQDAARLKDVVTKMALRKGMKQFVPTNDSHIRELLYEKLEWPVLQKTKNGDDAVDKNTFKRLLMDAPDTIGKDGAKLLHALMDYNSADKLGSTWYGKPDADGKQKAHRAMSVAQLIQPVSRRSGRAAQDDIGLLHFWIFPLRARTGRRASGGSEEGDPQSRNSQNWPPAARGVIRSRYRNGHIAVCDFSRLEVVLAAWDAQDDKLLDYFINGRGYLDVAKEFWNAEVKDGTPQYKATKSLVLGLNYNMGWWHLANDLKYKAGFTFSNDWDKHLRETKKARRKYLRMFHKLHHNIKRRIAEVTRDQMIVSPSGRIRHFPHHGPDSEGFWHIKNQCVNFPIQSFASDVTGSAIVDYERTMLKEHGFSYNDWHSSLLEHPESPIASPVFNEVHDELDIDLHPKTGKRDLEILLDCMRNVRSLKEIVPDFKIKLKVDVQKVRAWGDAK